MLTSTITPRRLLLAATLLAASASTLRCAPTVVGNGGGDGGAPGSGTTSSSGTVTIHPTTGGSTSSGIATGGGCLKPKAAALLGFNQANPLGGFDDQGSGIAGSLFIDPPSAGTFSAGPGGMVMSYSQNQMVIGQFAGDPAFGARFSTCVDASAFSGITFEVYPQSVPAGSRSVLRVLTSSTTPPPFGHCDPQAAGGCVAPLYATPIVSFGPKAPYPVAWGDLTPGSDGQPGGAAAKEIVGLEWVIDGWEGPPPTAYSVQVTATNVAFTP